MSSHRNPKTGRRAGDKKYRKGIAERPRVCSREMRHKHFLTGDRKSNPRCGYSILPKEEKDALFTHWCFLENREREENRKEEKEVGEAATREQPRGHRNPKTNPTTCAARRDASDSYRKITKKNQKIPDYSCNQRAGSAMKTATRDFTSSVIFIAITRACASWM